MGQVIFLYDIVKDNWSMNGASWNTAYSLMGELKTNRKLSTQIAFGTILRQFLKPLQNKKGQKNLGYPSLFPYKRTAFFSGTPNFFGPSYFEATLVLFF